MEKTIRKKRSFLALLLAMVLGATSLLSTTTEVEAAKNKALQVSYSFKNSSYEKDEEDCRYNNHYGVVVFGTNKKTAVKNLKMSADVYVPKKFLKKKNAMIDLGSYLDLFDTKGNYVGWMGGNIYVTVANENGKIKTYAWNETKGKNVKASSYVSCKAGTGAYKNYYVINLKNIPFQSVFWTVESDADKANKVTSKTKYCINVGIGITGQNYKHSGKLYIDNMKVTSGKKTIVNQTFTKKPTFYGVENRGKYTEKKKSITIVKF